MAELRLVGAVGVKVRPDASGFRVDTRRKIERELQGYEPKVNVNGRVNMDTRQAERDLERLQVQGRRELQSLQAVARDTRNSIDSIFTPGRGQNNAVTNFTQRLRSELAAAKELTRQAELARMRFAGNNDAQSLQDVLALRRWKDAAKSVLALQGEFKKSLKDSGFDRVQQKINSIAGSTEHLGRISDDTASAVGRAVAAMNGHWARFDAEQRRRIQDVMQAEDNSRIGMIQNNFEEATERIRQTWDQFTTRQLYDMLNSGIEKAANDAANEIDRRRRALGLERMFGQDGIDRAAARRAAELLALQTADNTRIEFENIRAEADETAAHIERLNPSLLVNTKGMLEAAAQMRWASRPRTVPFYVKVNQKSVAVAEGILKSLAGINTLESTGRFLENIVTNLDNFSIKTTSVATGIAAITNTLTYMATTMLSVGEGVAQSVGLLATAPAALATIAATAVITTAAFEDFKDAIDGDAEALAALPPAARETALALQGTWEMIQQPTQDAFWEGMGDGLEQVARVVLPRFRDGLALTATHVGRFGRGVMESLVTIAENGDLDRMLENLSQGFDNAVGAAQPLVDAINRLGLRGSEYLPEFGTWLTDIATRFDNWITKADENGDINRWIEQGVQSLKDMWSVGGSVIDMFRGLTASANIAGASGLPEFRDNMRAIADMMLREPFRSRMARIFAGARDGASELNVGVKELGETIGEASLYVEQLLVSLGRIGGGVLLGLSAILDSELFQSGTLAGLQGMQDMLEILEPSFERLGPIIGGVARIAGALFRGVAPILNTVTEILSDTVERLGPGLEELVPHLTQFVDGILMLAGGPIGALVELLAEGVDVLNDMPAALQGIALGAGAFLLLRGHFAEMFTSLNKTSEGTFTRLTENWQLQRTLALGSAEGYGSARTALATLGATFPVLQPLTRSVAEVGETASRAAGDAGRMSAGFGRAFGVLNVRTTDAVSQFKSSTGTLRGSASLMASGVAESFRTAVAPVGHFVTSVGSATAAIGRTAGQGLRLAAGGLMGVLGGPWGIALMAGVTILGAFAKKQAEAKAAVDEMTASLNEQTGAITKTSEAIVAKAIIDDDGIAGFKSASETLQAMGRSIEDTSRIVAAASDPYDNLIAKLKAGEAAAKAADPQFDKFGNMIEGNTEAWDAWLKEMDIAPGAIRRIDLTNLIAQLEEQAGVSQAATRNWELMNDSFTETNPFLEDFADGMALLSDETSTAEDRIRGLDAALAALNGEAPSADVAMRNLNDQMRQARDIFKDAEGNVLDFSGVVDATTGKINTVTEAGSNLHKSLSDVVRETKLSADALAQQGATTPEVVAHINAQKDAWVDSATAALGSREAAEAAWDYMLNNSPEEIATLITADITDATAKSEEVQALWNSLGAKKAVMAITGNDEQLAATYVSAMAKVDELDAAVATANADLDADALRAEQERVKLELIELAETDPTVRALMDPRIFEQRRADLLQKIEDLGNRKPTPEVLAETAAAQAELLTVQGMLDAIRSKTVYVSTVYTETGPKPQGWMPRLGVPTMTGLNGGIEGAPNRGLGMQPGMAYAFENGGILEKPGAAKIYAPASTYRIFAEDTTGGESYIPLAASKRSRSISIWEQTGRLLGVYNDGGINGASTRRAGDAGRPINITVNGVPMDYAHETADVIVAAIKRAQRGGVNY